MPRPAVPYSYPPDSSSPHFSYEFFPPVTQAGTINLHDRISRMSSLGSAAISITWGAGGSTSDRSIELAEFVAKSVKGKDGKPLEVILHLTCTNMDRAKVTEALDKAKSIGVKNILALRGDPPREAEYGPIDPTPDTSSLPPFAYAVDLVKFIRTNYGDTFCIGVAGYPDSHPDSPNPQKDIEFLKEKVEAGADFIVTQLFYDVDGFLKWQQACRQAGITVPIVPGVMPIQNFASFRRMTNLCKANVPLEIWQDLEPIKTDDILVKEYGVKLAVRMVDRLVKEGKVEGVHFCTLNLEKSVRRVLEGLEWVETAPAPPAASRGVVDKKLVKEVEVKIPAETNASVAIQAVAAADVQPSHGSNPRSHVVGKLPAVPGGVHGDTWDEFPNGRFTDVRSPAYGELDGYGAGLKVSPNAAINSWGTPTSAADITKVFTSYLNNEIESIPWYSTPLDRESQAILPLLLKLNSEQGWWTVGSQPAVDGERSDHPLYGFGPKGGYIWQKSFVEFFVKKEVVDEIEERAKQSGNTVTFYAGNKKGDFKSNLPASAVNAVTWAVFPGQEIVQSTIIEEMSFQSWKEEAFSIWTDWSHLYPSGSASRKLLEGIADEYWLISVICHDFKRARGLEEFLLEGSCGC